MITKINSSENKKYKKWQKLLKRKYRESERAYIIEGYKLIEEALINGKNIIEIMIDEECASQVLEEITPLVGDRNIPMYILDVKMFKKITQLEHSTGVMAVTEMDLFTEEGFCELFEGRGGVAGNLIVLDRLQDPGNIGTIIRTADGAGFGGIIAVKGTADIYSPKVVRSAVGSIFRMPVFFAEDNAHLIRIIERLQKKLVVTCFETDFYHFDAPLSQDAAIVIGNEGAGVSRELIDLAETKVKIPMSGNIDSLNASVAAGILMYEAVRQASAEE